MRSTPAWKRLPIRSIVRGATDREKTRGRKPQMAFARGEMRKKSGILACGMPMSRKCAGKIGSL